MKKIKLLSPHVINQIAAGEVVERPASIIKELVENSLDAGATRISVSIKNGGKTFISVQDNGEGISKEDLPYVLHPHATSKLTQDNLIDILTLGFRGEAMASIASISNMQIKSKYKKALNGFSISVDNGIVSDVTPTPIHQGTIVTVSDIFYSIPARLKFLKGNNIESTNCYRIFNQLAISHPHVEFTLENNGKLIFNYLSSEDSSHMLLNNRAEQILGSDFIKNAIYIEDSTPMLKITGFISSPTFSKTQSLDQYLIINQRSIKNKALAGLINFAYADVIFNAKHPSYILFMDINPQEIDVNVSPTKSDIRFRDISFIKHVLINLIKSNVSNINTQNNHTTLGAQLINKNAHPTSLLQSNMFNLPLESRQQVREDKENSVQQTNYWNKASQIDYSILPEKTTDFPLGIAKAQLHKNWIIAQNKDGFILIDQHAAHERITQEQLKIQYLAKNIPVQLLLTPCLIELKPEEVLIFDTYKTKIKSLGIDCAFFGQNIVIINAVPTILGNTNIDILFKNLLIDISSLGNPQHFDEQINNIISSLACHGSIRSGRILSLNEMNDLLRTMEKTINYAQCSHGRPTYIHITLKDIEKLFGRV